MRLLVNVVMPDASLEDLNQAKGRAASIEPLSVLRPPPVRRCYAERQRQTKNSPRNVWLFEWRVFKRASSATYFKINKCAERDAQEKCAAAARDTAINSSSRPGCAVSSLIRALDTLPAA